MKKLILFFASVLLIAGPALAVDSWLPNFEDVPQMENTYVVADAGFVYSQADGKIVQTVVASDTVSRRKFQRFYKDALYELGWKNIQNDRAVQIFTRGEDVLSIKILETDPLSAEFTLTPKE